MADLSITASQVLPGSSGRFQTLLAGEAITAGQLCYKDGTSAKLADNDNSSSTATLYGVAVNGAASGQKITLQTGGTVTIGAAASVAKGSVYGASSTAGGIAPVADNGTDDYVSLLGIGDASNGIALDINNSGIQSA